MRLKFFKSLSVLMSLILFISVFNFPTLIVKADSGSGVEGFVERCYTVILGRDSDPDGLTYWTEALKNGERVGTNVAYGFVFSTEYADRNRTNEEFVNDMYSLVLDREADAGGYEYWCTKLENGETRQQVYGGFVNSPEFYGICQQYGITAGYFLAEYDYMQVNNVNLFVDRLYRTCLGRPGDQGGQEYWVRALINKEITGIECAAGFVNSIEYRNNGLSNEDYVENMYSACLGRHSEPNGKAYWVNALVNGMTRDELFAGFANSNELNDICAEYGITRGDYTPTDIGTFDPSNPNNTPIPDHTHNYNQKNTDSKYLKSAATCTEAAVYCMSCECGECDENNTFTSGSPLGHAWDDGEVTKEPTEKEEGIKTYKCTRCNETKTESIEKLNHTHVFNQRVVDPKYLKSIATCTEAAVYYLSCECGEKGTETFTLGEALGHQFDQENIEDKYLKSAATCTEAAVYYKSCVRCGEKDEEHTFTSGDALGHDWDEGTVTKEATAIEDGVKTYYCKREGCNEIKTEVISCNLGSIKVGDIIQFGEYEQDGDESNGQEDIEWQVLSVEEDRILVISEYGLDYQEYDKNTVSGNNTLTWETCSLRKWLNNDFFNIAFSDNEKSKIQTVTLVNKDNSFSDTVGGNDTVDKVFCLSLDEIKEYYGDIIGGFSQSLLCTPTQYAIDQGAYINYNGEKHIITVSEAFYNDEMNDIGMYYYPYGLKYYGYTSDVIGRSCYSWWLRSPGSRQDSAGVISDVGYVSDYRSTQAFYKQAVRPAMYIKYITGSQEHTHTYNCKVVDEEYLKKSATCTEPAEYYMVCRCGEIDKANAFPYGKGLGHDWDEGKVEKEATATEEGVITYRCKRDGCNETKTEAIPKGTIEINEQIFPDDVFREYIINNIDTNNDGRLSNYEIENTQVMSINNAGNLKGIDYFNSLSELYCSDCNDVSEIENLSGLSWLSLNKCNIDELDLQKNIGLKSLRFDYCSINELDLSNNTQLEYIILYYNQLEELDLSNNTLLCGLTCESNNLKKLELGNNLVINYIDCSNNQLTDINVSKCSNLETLICSNNKLTSINLSNNPKLGWLDLDDNQITKLDLSNNKELKSYLRIKNNQIEKLDLINNPLLELLDCSGNKLTSIDVSNNLELKYLNCENNSLGSLDVKNNTKLGSLSCGENKISDLDLSQNEALYYLSCYDNSLQSLSLNKNINLTRLLCGNEEMTELDLSQNDKIWELWVDGTKIKELNLSNNPELKYLYCNNNQLEQLIINNSTKLIKLDCDRNQLKDLDLSNATELEELNCSYNLLKELDLSKSTDLKKLNCNNNKLEDLDLCNNSLLENLSCADNQLTILDVRNNTSLIDIICENNQLTDIYLGKNTTLQFLFCYGNKISQLNISENPMLLQAYNQGEKYYYYPENSSLCEIGSEYCVETSNIIWIRDDSSGILGICFDCDSTIFTGQDHTHVFSSKTVDDIYLKKKATCTEPAEYYLSCDCGEKGTETFLSGNALGHDWDDGTVTKEATATEEGIKTYICKRTGCSETKTEVIPCLSSNDKVGEKYTTTIASSGWWFRHDFEDAPDELDWENEDETVYYSIYENQMSIEIRNDFHDPNEFHNFLFGENSNPGGTWGYAEPFDKITFFRVYLEDANNYYMIELYSKPTYEEKYDYDHWYYEPNFTAFYGTKLYSAPKDKDLSLIMNEEFTEIGDVQYTRGDTSSIFLFDIPGKTDLHDIKLLEMRDMAVTIG